MNYWIQCKDCHHFFDQLKYRLCPSKKCAGAREARRRAEGEAPWHQCYCKKWYQAPKRLEMCPTCQVRHDQRVENDRAQLEAMKRPIGG